MSKLNWKIVDCWRKTLTQTNNFVYYIKDIHMGESFQDYSWIQDYEADFSQKVSLKMLK